MAFCARCHGHARGVVFFDAEQGNTLIVAFLQGAWRHGSGTWSVELRKQQPRKDAHDSENS